MRITAITAPPLTAHSDLDTWRGSSGLHSVAEIEPVN